MEIKKTFFIIAIILIILIGLSFFPSPYKEQQKTEEEVCIEQGGQWETISSGLGTKPECNLPTRDSGKVCTDSNECESFCQAPEKSPLGSEVMGTCYQWQKAICRQEVKDGKAEPEWCYGIK